MSTPTTRGPSLYVKTNVKRTFLCLNRITNNVSQGAPAKPGFSQADTPKQGEISSKQQGVSNTPTRHSIPIHESNEKSKKPEGGPDSAKSMGTIDPGRPQK